MSKLELEKKYKEKYKDVELVDASKHYYGTGNAMDRVIEEMNEAVKTAAEKFEEVKGNYDEPHMRIFINQDTLEMVFSSAKFDEDEYEWVSDKEVYRHFVGEAMAEALVLMQMMEDSDYSTGINQATNNWIEDIDFSDIGEFDEDYSVADQYDYIDY